MARIGKIERILAAKVLKSKGQGRNVSNELAASARRVLQNKGTDADVRAIRDYLGIKRSGAGALNRAARRIRGVTRPIENITREVDILASAEASGTSKSAAQQRLLSITTREMQRFVKGKFAKGVAESVVKFLGRDPVIAGRFLKSLGRGLRLGGAVGSIALAGFQAANFFVSARARGARSQANTSDVLRQLNTDPRIAREIRDRFLQQTRKASVLPAGVNFRTGNKFLDSGLSFVDDALKARISEQSEKKAKAFSSRLAGARAGAADVIQDFPGFKARLAKRLGKRPEELTPREINEAVDPVLKERAGFGKSGLKGELQKQENLFVNRRLLEGSIFERTLFRSLSPQAQDAKVQEIRDEFRLKVLKTRAQARRDRQALASQTETLRGIESPAKNMQIEHQRQFDQASRTAWTSRHRAWAND